MSEELDKSNYREFAKKAIQKYLDKNMLVDAMVWSKIIGFYEAENKRLNDAINSLMGV